MKNNKNFTLEDLANKVDKLAVKTDDLNGSLENLATLTAKGFEGVEKRMATKIEPNEVKQKLSILDTKVENIYEVVTCKL